MAQTYFELLGIDLNTPPSFLATALRKARAEYPAGQEPYTTAFEVLSNGDMLVAYVQLLQYAQDAQVTLDPAALRQLEPVARLTHFRVTKHDDANCSIEVLPIDCPKPQSESRTQQTGEPVSDPRMAAIDAEYGTAGGYIPPFAIGDRVYLLRDSYYRLDHVVNLGHSFQLQWTDTDEGTSRSVREYLAPYCNSFKQAGRKYCHLIVQETSGSDPCWYSQIMWPIEDGPDEPIAVGWHGVFNKFNWCGSYEEWEKQFPGSDYPPDNYFGVRYAQKRSELLVLWAREICYWAFCMGCGWTQPAHAVRAQADSEAAGILHKLCSMSKRELRKHGLKY